MTRARPSGRPREPRRHDAGKRNRRKALRSARQLRAELEYLYADLERRMTAVKYAVERSCRLVDRLKSEAENK